MIIQRFVCNMLEENCYVVSDDTRQCVIIDCGAYYEAERQAIVKYINDNQLEVVHLIATHGHFDHNFGNAHMAKAFGCGVEISAADVPLLNRIGAQASMLMQMDYTEQQPAISRQLADGDRVVFGRHELEVVATPGHSPGGIFLCCREENIAFSGDTLFRMSIGRTDFIGGSYEQLADSLQRVYKLLPDDTTIFPGHGPQTTIGDERRYNPYVRMPQ